MVDRSQNGGNGWGKDVDPAWRADEGFQTKKKRSQIYVVNASRFPLSLVTHIIRWAEGTVSFPAEALPGPVTHPHPGFSRKKSSKIRKEENKRREKKEEAKCGRLSSASSLDLGSDPVRRLYRPLSDSSKHGSHHAHVCFVSVIRQCQREGGYQKIQLSLFPPIHVVKVAHPPRPLRSHPLLTCTFHSHTDLFFLVLVMCNPLWYSTEVHYRAR